MCVCMRVSFSPCVCVGLCSVAVCVCVRACAHKLHLIRTAMRSHINHKPAVASGLNPTTPAETGSVWGSPGLFGSLGHRQQGRWAWDLSLKHPLLHLFTLGICLLRFIHIERGYHICFGKKDTFYFICKAKELLPH